MAKAEPVPIADDEPFASAARRVLAVRAREFLDLIPAARSGDEIEALHDLRVAGRRLRSVLEVFDAAFPRKLHRSFVRELKAALDELGEARDLDVQLELIDSFLDAATGAARPGIAALDAHLRGERAAAYAAFQPALDAVEDAGFQQRLHELVTSEVPA
jgi:CHAD domain-containing protein